MGNKKYHLIFLVLVCLFLSGCECVYKLTVRGTVLDGASKPISEVQVFLMTMNSSETDAKAEAMTKDDGTYSIEVSYAYRRNSYVIFKKPGYQDVDTKGTPFGDLDACKLHDVTIVRDAVMKP